MNMHFALPAAYQMQVPTSDPSMEMIFDGSHGLVMYMRSPLFDKLVPAGKWVKMDLGKMAKKQGVEVKPLMSLINQSMVRSGVVDYKAPFVMARDFSANFPMRLMHKDIRLMLEAARQNGVKLPGLETVDKVYESSAREGNANLDYAATLMTLEKAAGVS